MMSLTVVEAAGEAISRLIASQLETGPEPRQSVLLSALRPDGPMPGRCPDVLVISPQAARRAPARREALRCGTLLVPDGAALSGIDAVSVVSYGMSPKDTLTYSSIGEDGCIVSLQRELVTVSGGVIERQEFAVRGGARAQETLAAAGALLLLGVTPES